MKKMLALMVLAVAGLPAFAQPTEAEIRARFAAELAVRSLEKKTPEIKVVLATSKTPLDDAFARAKKQGFSVVVYCQTDRTLPFDNAISLRDDSYGKPGVYLFLASDLDHSYRFPVSVTASEINAWLRGRTVSQSAVPFVEPPSSAGRDGDDMAAGPWPKSLPKPNELRRFTRAKYTQAIATTNNAPSIDLVHRSRLEAKWQVPGGLEGVSGWHSDVYRMRAKVKTWQTYMPVLNRFGYFQNELGYTRSYEDGTTFADVLSKDGKVFEVRYAVKRDGHWDRFVAFKDVSARPSGYAPPTSKQCVECHSQTGSGNYGVGMVPGGDTIISEPLEGLE